jgi:hypothetical protein
MAAPALRKILGVRLEGKVHQVNVEYLEGTTEWVDEDRLNESGALNLKIFRAEQEIKSCVSDLESIKQVPRVMTKPNRLQPVAVVDSVKASEVPPTKDAVVDYLQNFVALLEEYSVHKIANYASQAEKDEAKVKEKELEIEEEIETEIETASQQMRREDEIPLNALQQRLSREQDVEGGYDTDESHSGYEQDFVVRDGPLPDDVRHAARLMAERYVPACDRRPGVAGSLSMGGMMQIGSGPEPQPSFPPTKVERALRQLEEGEISRERKNNKRRMEQDDEEPTSPKSKLVKVPRKEPSKGSYSPRPQYRSRQDQARSAAASKASAPRYTPVDRSRSGRFRVVETRPARTRRWMSAEEEDEGDGEELDDTRDEDEGEHEGRNRFKRGPPRKMRPTFSDKTL